MNRELEKKEREEILEVYESTIGKDIKNIFTMDKFLKDCGYLPWGKTYLSYFYSYIHNYDLMDNINLVFIQENTFDILAFNVEDYGFDYLSNSIDLIKEESENDEAPLIIVDQFFIERIPSIVKIGVLNVAFMEHFSYLCKLIESNTNITVVKHNNWIDYHNIFSMPDTGYAEPEPQQYYDDEAQEVDEAYDEDAEYLEEEEDTEVSFADYSTNRISSYQSNILEQLILDKRILGDMDSDYLRDMIYKMGI